MNIGVFGLGYVGVVNVACMYKNGYKVFCTDVKSQKVHSILEGRSPIKEPDVEEIIREGVEAKGIVPTLEAPVVVANADVLLFCVGTPSKADGEVNLSFVKNVLSEVLQFLDKNDEKWLIFRSTVPPGTTEMLKQQFLDKLFPNVKILFYPEFLREGSAVKDFFNYGRCVIGSDFQDIPDKIINLLHVNKERPLFITNFRTAEFSKYVDNSFHALKVVFANEIFRLGSGLGIDVKKAGEIFVSDTKLNISSKYLKPGMPYGGSCLPKDVREIQHLMHQQSLDLHILKSIIPSNDAFIEAIYQKILSVRVKKVSFVGITFKNNSDDLRESPILKMAERLSASGFEIKIWDEDLNLSTMRIDFPHLYLSIKEFSECISQTELIIVSKRYLNKVKESAPEKVSVINLSDEIDSPFMNLY
jgi:GDP-mannose 6-dehydrogenase